MKLLLPPPLRSGRLAGFFLLGIVSLFVLAAPAGAQNITKTVAPNIGSSDNFVDIKNTSGDRWEFFSAPTPSPARMARVSANSVAVDQWPSVPNFAPDPTDQSQNRIYAGEYLRVYPGNLPVNTVITIPFTYGVAANTHYNFNIIVTNGAQVTSITLLNPNPTTAALVRWKVNFDVPISGVTAANFEFNNPALITGLSFASVTADTAQPSASWTVSANTGSGNGLLGLNWLQHVSESPVVPNSFTGYQYDFQFAPVINKDPASVTINRNSTATLTVDAAIRGGGTPNYQWYSGTSVHPETATAISGATAASYTPANFASIGAYSYFCHVTTTPGNYTNSAPAVITVVDPPKITTSPASQAIYIGQTATLQVAATGTDLHYQWYLGSSPNTSTPVGPDAATFITPALSNDASYWVKVSNGGPTIANSATASLTVTEQPSLVVTTASDVVNNRDTLTSLREAVAYANSLTGPQTITFAPALAGQSVALNTGGSSASDPSALTISGNVTVQGGSAFPGVTLALAQGVQKRHFYVANGGVLTVNNLTLANGYASDYGGSIWSQGSLTVRGCTFSGNTAGTEGGAIQSWGDSPLAVIENSTFSGNSSLGVAGAFDLGAQQITVRNITAVHNSANSGSAIVFYKNSPLFVNNLVAANTNDGISLVNGAILSAQSTNNITGAGGTGGLVSGTNGNLTGVPEAQLYLGTLDNHGGPTPTVNLLPASPAINSGATLANLTSDQRGYSRGPLTNGLLGRYYAISSTPNANIISPLSNLEGFPPTATVLTPRIDFGAGTDTTLGDGSVLDRTGTGSNPFGSLGVVLPVDNIAAIWTGFINLPETADYRFTLRSDDGSVLFIDGVQVIDNNKLQSITNVSSPTLHLGAGRHRVKLAYFDAGGDAGMQWSWEQLTGSAPFARKVVPPQVLSCGSVPDIGAYEDPTGDEDPDGDTLSNFQECQLGSNPLSPDTDGDGFNDATEMLDGTNPLSPSSVPASTHVERVLGYGPGRGLDLSGNFLYAFNLGTTVAVGQAGDATFTTDTSAGITLSSSLDAAPNWAACQFGMTTGDHVLETLFNTDRWAKTDGAPSSRTLKVKLGALTVGRHYKLQLLFGDAAAHKRVFDIAVNGTVIVPGFDTSVAQGVQSWSHAGSAVVYEFNAPASDLNIELSGLNAPAGVDRNPLLSGLTLEGLPTAAVAPAFTTAAGTYTDSVTVSIAPPVSAGSAIRYTLDGSDPSETTGTLYTAPINLTSGADVRAIAVGGGWLPSTIVTSSYIVQIPVSSWRATVSLPPDGSQDMAAPAGDGVPNLQKFAFNMAPTQGSLTVPNTTTVTATSDSGLPAVTKDPGEDHLTIVFVRRKASTNSGLIYTVETGTSLTDMKPLDLSGATVESIDGTWERVTVIDPAASKERFAWVRVTTL